MPSPAFPFFVGCARSGTTLLRAMLDSHPQLAVPGESYFPLWLGRERSRYERPSGFDLERYINDVLSDAWFLQWGLPANALRTALAERAPRDFPDAVRCTFSAYARHQGKERYGDKTPTFVLHISKLAKLFPETKFVHLVRDGRDTALSLLEVGWGPTRFDQAALHWRAHVLAGRRAGLELGADRYVEVHYEDLSSDPEPAVRRLCAFLDLTFEPSMLHYYERAEQLMRALPSPEEHRNLARPPAPIRDWRTQLTRQQVQLFAALAGQELEEFGYERGSQPTGRDRLSALAARTRWEASRARRKGRSMAWQVLKRRRRIAAAGAQL